MVNRHGSLFGREAEAIVQECIGRCTGPFYSHHAHAIVDCCLVPRLVQSRLGGILVAGEGRIKGWVAQNFIYNHRTIGKTHRHSDQLTVLHGAVVLVGYTSVFGLDLLLLILIRHCLKLLNFKVDDSSSIRTSQAFQVYFGPDDVRFKNFLCAHWLDRGYQLRLLFIQQCTL